MITAKNAPYCAKPVKYFTQTQNYIKFLTQHISYIEIKLYSCKKKKNTFSQSDSY